MHYAHKFSPVWRMGLSPPPAAMLGAMARTTAAPGRLALAGLWGRPKTASSINLRRIGDAGRGTVGDAEAGFNFPQHQHATVRGELAAVKTGDDSLAADR